MGSVEAVPTSVLVKLVYCYRQGIFWRGGFHFQCLFLSSLYRTDFLKKFLLCPQTSVLVFVLLIFRIQAAFCCSLVLLPVLLLKLIVSETRVYHSGSFAFLLTALVLVFSDYTISDKIHANCVFCSYSIFPLSFNT